MASSVFGRRSEYKLQFNHEDDGRWYVDLPGWPFDHHNLMMVAGADKLCAFLSDDDKFAHIDVIPANREESHPGYAKLVQQDHSLTGGSTYMVTGLEGFERLSQIPLHPQVTINHKLTLMDNNHKSL